MSVLHPKDDIKSSNILRETVFTRLEALCTQKSLAPLKDLFWKDLGYQRQNKPLPFPNWQEREPIQQYLDQHDPLTLFATDKQGDFHVIYIHLSTQDLPLTYERLIITHLLNDHPYALFIVSNAEQDQWHFVNVAPHTYNTGRNIFRRITVRQEEQLHTAAERLALLDLAGLEAASHVEINSRHNAAFDVAAVTKAFFERYQKLFREIEKVLRIQTGDPVWAHDYALLFLNRCMFLYFIQRKGWLGGDRRFLSTFWQSYTSSTLAAKDSFFEKWLQVFFFQALNREFDPDDERNAYFPPDISKILANAPFINGGLFSQGALDSRSDFTVSDAVFLTAFTFFEGYNFTIAEDSPLDQEVAVDPEMIGRVYESLVNVSSELDERGDAGIFYTPRTEIDLMCRLTIVDFLSNNLPEIEKQSLYEMVFALDPDEKQRADTFLQEHDYWKRIYDHLFFVTVLDPACGSGAFLLGMLHVLDDLQARANYYLNREESDYERRKRIIGRSLYGVDIMPWAVRVVELRLWLTLVVASNLTLDQLHNRRDPILPYFAFKVRHGDSLVQQVGELTFAHRQATNGISTMLQRRLSDLTAEKEKFYGSQVEYRFKTPEAIEEEERHLFIDIIREQEDNLQRELISLKAKLDLNRASESPSLGMATVSNIDRTMRAEIAGLQKQLAEKEVELSRWQEGEEKLRAEKQVPFIWDISFAEIFSGANQGFDIVIGNPPYVRQENISDPRYARTSVPANQKRAYKQKLADTIHQAFKEFFLYKPEAGKAVRELDAKSDLYIYFYLHGLHLLKPNGSFCFITSNSWLDVGYGAVLQEFLLQYCKVKLIIDNAAKRSFATADVNTVITLFSAPGRRDQSGQETMMRFVLFTVDFEQVLSATLFKQIEQTGEPTTTPFYRLYPISQRDLLNDGTTLQKRKASGKPAKKQATESAQSTLPLLTKYTGNKWGGKYLRAPDIYWVLMQKGKEYLQKLGDIAEIHYGIKTGANDFFYLDDEKIRHWGIEEAFLRPVVKSPTECTSIFIRPHTLKSHLFFCQQTEAELKGTAALTYIRWGEAQGFHTNASVSGRARWWSFPIETGNSIFVKEAHNTSAVFYNPDNYPVDCRLYYADLPTITLAYLNSAIGALLFEIYNRAGLGGGARSMMVSDYALVPALRHLPAREEEATLVMNQVYQMAARKLVIEDEQKPTRSGSQLFDEPWKLLDDFIFGLFQLTTIERNAIYEAVINLVEARLKKATSLQNGKRPEGPERQTNSLLLSSTPYLQEIGPGTTSGQGR